ncbi:MAG: protein kinase [Opitutales bacterium]
MNRPTPASPARFDHDDSGGVAVSDTMTLPADVSALWAKAIPSGTPPDATIRMGDAMLARGDGTVAVNDDATVRMDEAELAQLRNSSAGMPQRPPKEVAPPQPPAKFSLGRLLGEGGMGQVYEGKQEVLERTVALKTLKGHEDTFRREVFLMEALTTGSLGHPAIPPVHDLAYNAEGRPFLVMKKVEGRLWSDALGGMSLSENLEVLLRVADGVAFAHARNVIHRDIKPSNIRLGPFGEVYLMDWGLAVTLDETGRSPVLSASCAGGGTPAYMAPEMALADGTKIGRQSDIYLLGAVLFEIVTGQRPHRSDSVTRALEAAAANRIAPIDEENELLEIAMKAMATQPESRFPSVKALQQAIRDYREHAESLALAQDGERYLGSACDSKGYEPFVEALSSFKQALKLWPANSDAADGLRRARHAYARCALRRNDLELAGSQLDPNDPGHDELCAAIQKARQEDKSRRRRLKTLGRSVMALAGVIILGLGISTGWIAMERERAEDALTDYRMEQLKRQDDRRQSAPALLLTARRLIAEGDYAAAMSTAEAAVDFDPDLLEARFIHLALLLREENFDAAREAAKGLLSEAPGYRDAADVLAILLQRQRGDEPDRVLLSRLSPILTRQNLPTLAAEFAASNQEKLAIWQQQITDAYPDWREHKHNLLRWENENGVRLVLARVPSLNDLSPLRGIPIVALDISHNSGVSDLSPLVGMPLRELSVSYCHQITDLRPLGALPLEHLSISGLERLENLESLRGIPLRVLNAYNVPRIASLEPLRGMPLEQLSITHADSLTDLSPLAGMPLRMLNLPTNGNLEDISPLAGLPIEVLNLYQTPVTDFEALRGMPLRKANFGPVDVTSIDFLESAPLEELSLANEPPVDVAVLEGKPLRQLQIGTVEDVAPLATLPLERLQLGHILSDHVPENLATIGGLTLERLTLEGAGVTESLDWLDGARVKELHIRAVPWVETPPLDLSPLHDAEIEVLTFPPFVDVRGTEAVRGKESLKKIGPGAGKTFSPQKFWSIYDAGGFMD